MNYQELVNKFSLKYPGASNYDIEDMRRWLSSQALTERQLDQLYDEVSYTYNYRKFPTLATVIEAWGRIKPSGAGDYDSITDRENRIIDGWYKMAVKDILIRLKDIRKKINEGRADFTDKTFFNLFDDILVEYNIMMDAEFEGDRIKGHLEYVLDCLKDRKKFRSIGESITNKNLDKIQDRLNKVFPSRREA